MAITVIVKRNVVHSVRRKTEGVRKSLLLGSKKPSVTKNA